MEAGPEDRNPWIHVPVGYYRTMYDPEISWGYETEQVPGAARRTIKWPRGRVLGGCSAINGLVYARGQREDFDHWRQLGNQGWAYDPSQDEWSAMSTVDAPAAREQLQTAPKRQLGRAHPRHPRRDGDA